MTGNLLSGSWIDCPSLKVRVLGTAMAINRSPNCVMVNFAR
jgi:hypothetical protein